MLGFMVDESGRPGPDDTDAERPLEGARVLKTYRMENNRFCESTEPDCPIRVFVNPDPAERTLLTGDYRIDEHTLASALDPDEVSRLEYEPDHVAVILKRPRNYSSQDDVLFKVTSLGVFVYADKLVAVMAEEIPIFEFDPKRLMKIGDLKAVFLKIVFGTISRFFAHLRTINQIAEAGGEKDQLRKNETGTARERQEAEPSALKARTAA
jgi:magnesium transporter